MNIFQKAISSVSTLIKSTWVDITEQGFFNYQGGRRKSLSKYGLLGEYQGLVYACITAIAEDVGLYEPIFSKLIAVGKTQMVEHPFRKLLKRPNPFQSQFEFMEATQSYIEATGDSFWYVNVGELTGRPKELYIMRPDKVEVLFDLKTGDITGYAFMSDDGSRIPLDLNEVIHIKTFNPTNKYRGMSTIQAGLLYIQTENATSEFQYNFMHNHASPAGVLSLKGKSTAMSKESFKRIKDEWKEQHAGVSNAGKTLIVREADADFKKIGLSLADIDMKQLKDMTEDKVLKMFKVPKAILGESDSSGLGRANVETIEYIFAKRTINPKLIRIDDAISLYISKYYKEDTYKDVTVSHVSQVPADKEAELKYDDTAINKWETVNEIRARRGLPPKEGGDKLYVAFNINPIDQEVSTDSSETKTVVKKVVRLATKAENTEALLEATDKIESKTAKKVDHNLDHLLEAQQRKALELMGNFGGKSKKKQEVLLHGIDFDFAFTAAEIMAFVKYLLTGYEESGKVTLKFVGKPDIDFLIDQATRDAVFNSTERQMKSFNEETALKLQKQLAAGISEGETTEQLAKRVESVYDEARGYRAERIARTEAHDVINEGIGRGYQAAGARKIVWRTRGGACPYCEQLEGKEVVIGESFIPQGGKVTAADGQVYSADYQSIKWANLHPNCDCYPEAIF